MPDPYFFFLNRFSQKSLETAIKHKVNAKLEEGNKRLTALRQQLQTQFKGAHSLFGKAELAELRHLSKERRAELAAVCAPE
jgi:hypothetical protein